MDSKSFQREICFFDNELPVTWKSILCCFVFQLGTAAWILYPIFLISCLYRMHFFPSLLEFPLSTLALLLGFEPLTRMCIALCIHYPVRGIAGRINLGRNHNFESHGTAPERSKAGEMQGSLPAGCQCLCIDCTDGTTLWLSAVEYPFIFISPA